MKKIIVQIYSVDNFYAVIDSVTTRFLNQFTLKIKLLTVKFNQFFSFFWAFNMKR